MCPSSQSLPTHLIHEVCVDEEQRSESSGDPNVRRDRPSNDHKGINEQDHKDKGLQRNDIMAQYTIAQNMNPLVLTPHLPPNSSMTSLYMHIWWCTLSSSTQQFRG